MELFRTVTVHTGRPYDILVGQGLLEQLPARLEQLEGRRPKLAIVTDSHVDPLYGQQLLERLRRQGWQAAKFVFPAGEASKHLGTVQEVYQFFSREQITRSDLVVALGGGVVGDLAGFAAATWLRGVRFVQVPTTLLAMIDSSVGGKTGVDLPEGKNLVGAFWQPSLVVCDVDTLGTLPEETFADGVAEAIKYGAILDPELFGLLEQGQLREHLLEVIARCIQLKQQVVEQDERDTGLRQCLNFGHTLGHALEKYHQFALSHGKGVAIGMVMLTGACERRGITPPGTAQRIAACCRQYGLPTGDPAPLDALCQNCLGDKKRSGSRLTLVVLDRIGQFRLYPVEAEALPAFLEGARHG